MKGAIRRNISQRTIRKWLIRICLLAFFVIAFLVLSASLNNFFFWSQSTGIENVLTDLGNPLAASGQKGRARNVWDLQAFDNKIYVAGGSTVENSGPIDVLAYNPSEKEFEQEYTVQEEAIEHYRVFDNQLYIPASDPVKGDAHKFYRREINQPWQKFQDPSIELAHVRDLIKLESGEVLLVGNNRHFKQLSKPATAMTQDEGQTFEEAGIENAPRSEYNWFFSVFSYQGKVYAPTSALRDSIEETGTIAVFNPETQKFELDPQLSNQQFIPHSSFKPSGGKHGFYVIYRPWHPIEFKQALFYPVRSISYYDKNYTQAYMNSIGFFVKTAPSADPVEIIFPDDKSVGEDTLMIDDELYVLANTKVAPDKFIVYLYKTSASTAPYNWEEVLHFRSHNRARSFEALNGTFYFGLGQDYDEPIGKAGEILSFTSSDFDSDAN